MTKQPKKTCAPSAGAIKDNPINPRCLPTGVEEARDWLKDQRVGVHGPSQNWGVETWDRYHRDLGLLVDFVTDCWPRRSQPDSPPAS